MNLLNKKLLKNDIVRKRLRGANFYIKNVRIYKNINYILCIPINGFTSDKIQLIRDSLLKYGYKVDKFTTNSFLSFLKYNNILIDKLSVSNFYIGHMLVVTIEREKNIDILKESTVLDFLCKYISNKDLQYCNILYPSYKFCFKNSEKNKRTFVIYSLSKEKTNVLSTNLNTYQTKNINFINVQNVICNFLIVLLQYRLLLLHIFTAYNKINQKK